MSYSDIDFVTKKVLGYANTSLNSVTAFDSSIIPSFQKIMSNNQLYTQLIPTSAPVVSTNFGPINQSPSIVFKGYITIKGVVSQYVPTGAYGCLYNLQDFPYIQYVQSLPLTNVQKSSIFNTKIGTQGVNYFTNIIPFSYGPGYGYTLTQGYQISSLTIMNTSLACTPYQTNIINPNLYTIDTDAGLLYIKGGDWSLNTATASGYNSSNGYPTISFFRYAGLMGFPVIPPSSTPTTSDVWTNLNIVGAPSAPMSVTGTFTTTDAYIDFTYPDQLDSGMGLLPRIDTFYVNVYGTGDTGSTLITVPNTKATYSVTGSNYLSVTGPIGPTGSLFVTTDRIVNGAGTILINGTGSGILESSGRQPDIIQSINFSKTKKTGTIGMSPLGLKYYTINYQNVDPEVDVKGYLWYGNGNRNPNVASYYFKYLKAGNPAVVKLSAITAPSYNSLSFGWTGSTQIDSNDTSSSANLIYTISYGPTGSNDFRYDPTSSKSIAGPGTAFASTGTIVLSTGVTGMTGGYNPVQIRSSNTFPVFPDTNYLVTIEASNSTVGTGTGSFVKKPTIIGTTGPPLLYTQKSGSTGITGTTPLISAKPLSGSDVTPITNLLSTNTFGYSFTVPTVNIHNSMSSRGKSGELVNFTAFLNTLSGPSYTLNGFNSDNSDTVTTNGITVSTDVNVDQYALSKVGCDNYYLQNSMTVYVDTTLISPTLTEYNLHLNGIYINNNSDIQCTFSSKFHYDGEQIKPTIVDVSTTLSTLSTFKQCCGIYIVNPDPTTNIVNFKVEVNKVEGLGSYFYNSGWILQYSNPSISGATISTTSQYEKNLNNLIESYSNSNSFINSTLPIVLNPLTSYSTSAFTLNVQAQNLQGIKSTLALSSDKNGYYVFDQQALTYISKTSPSQVGLSATFMNGFRVYSSSNPGTYESFPNSTNGLASNNVNLYDNSQSLSSSYTYELLYANGKFCTPGLSPEYYQNYSAYYAGINNKNPDYSSTSIAHTSFRYATFIWSVPPSVFSSSTSYHTLNFSILNTTGINVYNGLVGTVDDYIQLYYCVIDSSSDVIPASQSKCITTYWINANALDEGELITANNCYTTTLPSTNYIGSSIPNITKFGNSLNFSVTSGGYSMSSVNIPAGGIYSPVYVYLRIGLPMISPVSFTNITCNLST